MLKLGSAIFQQLSSDDDPFDTEDDDDEGEDIIEYQGVCSMYLLCVFIIKITDYTAKMTGFCVRSTKLT